MKEISKDVNLTVNGVRTKVAEATVKIAETVQEALELDGEQALLDKRNALTLTNEMNRLRTLAASGPSKNALRDKAMSTITPEEWQSVAGDTAAIKSLVAQRIESIKQEMLTNAGVDPHVIESNEEAA